MMLNKFLKSTALYLFGVIGGPGENSCNNDITMSRFFSFVGTDGAHNQLTVTSRSGVLFSEERLQ